MDSSTCSNLNDLDTGIYNVNNYDGKITNVPFQGGSFMCVVAKQGDKYKYLLASAEGSLATKNLINGSWGSWAYYALKSDLESNLLYKEFTTESRSWKTLECHRLSYTVPNGYKFLTICYTRTNGWVGATYVVPVIGSFDFDIYVPAGSGNGTVTLGALFVKNV